MEFVFNKLGIENKTIKKENIRRNDDYRQYYNKYTRNIIEKLYKNDLKEFNYQF